jgi:AraC-like DNA-binding protein
MRCFCFEAHLLVNTRLCINQWLSQQYLDTTAAAFGMSSASFKRKLKKHQSHFQEQYDQVRKDLAVYWLNESGWSKEQVAKALHFCDVGNLRRAFKKWTGKLLPAKEKPIRLLSVVYGFQNF